MTKAQREILFTQYGGRCAYCGCVLSKGWHADHIESVGRISAYDKEKRKFFHTGELTKPENDHFENLIAACPSCNITKSGMSIENFRAYISRSIETLNKNHYAAYKFGKRFGLIQETPKPVIFHFETFTSLLPTPQADNNE